MFEQAVGRHQEFHGKLLLTGGLRRWLSRLNTPYYRALWQAFSDPGMTLAGEEPPLVISQTARREFERYFLLAYLAALESPAGRDVAAYLDGLQQYRVRLVRNLLVQDMAAWGGRHVFGNVPRERWTDGESVPFLPLDDLYVEPDGALERERWAERALAATSVLLNAVLPIYVRCAEDFPYEVVDLAATARRARKRQADGFGLSISDDDGALAWPSGRPVTRDDLPRAVPRGRSIACRLTRLAALTPE